MCYITLLSTTFDENLALYNTELVHFSATHADYAAEKYLAFKNKWYVSSRHGCSCGMRHLYVDSVELGFGEPEDWFPEEASNIEATHQFIAVVRALVEKGEEVDCVDVWSDEPIEPGPLSETVEVNLNVVSDSSFRFFENHRFTFSRD